MVEHSAYLLVGEDQLSKNKIIQSIKNKFLDNNLRELNFETVYGDDKNLKPTEFDEVLRYGPQEKDSKRVVLIKKTEALADLHREILLKCLKKPLDSVILILDCQMFPKEDSFFKSLSKLTKPLYIEKKRKENVFDLSRAIEHCNIKRALEILNYLLKNREQPLKILGGIYWCWEELREELSLEKFRKGLKILLEADLRIKTSAVKEDIALEMAVIRLTYLMH